MQLTTLYTSEQGQEDLQEWAARNPIKVIKCKCQALPQGGQGPCSGAG